MGNNQKGFSIVILLLLILVVAGISFLTTYIVLSSKKEPDRESYYDQTIHGSVSIIPQDQAFHRLSTAYQEYMRKTQEECPYFKGACLDAVLTLKDKVAIAKAYGITSASKETIYIGLQKGNDVDLRSGSEWYWEVGACPANKRTFIHPITGSTTGVSGYVYCGGMP